MSDTTSNLPVCVYCGTARPADETLCPNCGKPWIDVSVGDAAADSAAPPPVPSSDQPASSADTGEMPIVPPPPPTPGQAQIPPPPPSMDDTGEFSFDDWTLPPERPKSRARWLIPIVLLIAVVAVWALVFFDSDSTPTTTAALATTTTTASTTTSDATTTTGQETTTTAQQTTTTVAFPPPQEWQPVGDPIPTNELTLKAAAIGPIEFGASISDAAGMLVASLGEATASGTDGLCPDGEGYWLQWGDLLAVFSGFTDDASFVSYKYADVDPDGDLGLATLSGLELGDTVADLQSIYSAYTITFEVIDGKDHFRLIDAGELLLWGPVSSTESSGVVEGIYSPSSCAS